MSPASSAPPKRIPEFETALARDVVDFGPVLGSLASAEHAQAVSDRESLMWYHDRLLQKFSASRKGVERFYCDPVTCYALALTGDGEVHITSADYRIQSGARFAIDDLRTRANLSNARARELLRGLPLLSSAERTYEAVNGVFYAIALVSDWEDAAERRRHLDETLTRANLLLDGVDRYVEQAAQREAQYQYLVGMGLIGCPALAILSGLAALGLTFAGTGDDVLRTLFATATAGGLGAIVSVLARMTTGHLRLAYDSGRAEMRILGGVRPLVGAVFATAVYLLVDGSVLPVDVPADESEATRFFAAVGFVAGFSERFAQDMIATSETGVRGSASPATASQPSRPAEQPPTET